MIDIHNHIIFNVDDGSKSIEQSIEMIKMAKSVGVTDISFSPHYMEDGYKTEKTILYEKVDEIRNRLSEENIDINLYLGEEVFIFPEMADNIDKLVTINNSRYILFELPLVEEANFLDQVIYELMSLGKVPILAHPERYLITSKDISVIEDLAQKGVLLQININSLIGHYGSNAKKIATKLLKANMVQFAASDAHSVNTYMKLSESIPTLERIVGKEKAKEILIDNPRKVLNDEEIEVEEFKPISKSKGSRFEDSLIYKLLKR